MHGPVGSSSRARVNESYTPGYSTNASSFMARRTAQTHAAFLAPHLKPGARWLDCGCGPGSITLGLARAIAPGTIAAVDQEASQLALAKDNFRAAGLEGDFRVASIYDLPFPDETFDGVFAHAVFEHLREPDRALAELCRVLKPQGLASVRSPDWGGFVIAPASPALQRAIEFYQHLQTENGGDVLAGRKLKGWFQAAGLVDMKAGGSYESYDPVDSITEYLALRIEGSIKKDLAVERGWASEGEVNEMTTALRALPNQPGALFLQAWCEVIGRKV